MTVSCSIKLAMPPRTAARALGRLHPRDVTSPMPVIAILSLSGRSLFMMVNSIWVSASQGSNDYSDSSSDRKGISRRSNFWNTRAYSSPSPCWSLFLLRAIFPGSAVNNVIMEKLSYCPVIAFLSAKGKPTGRDFAPFAMETYFTLGFSYKGYDVTEEPSDNCAMVSFTQSLLSHS